MVFAVAALVCSQQMTAVAVRADSTEAPRQAATAVIRPPTGDQFVTGWMGSVLLGFAAWRAFDEPPGSHSRERQGWGYTPRAMSALAVGSFTGATLGIWLRGRHNGSRGRLLATAAGVAVPTVPVLLGRNDPLLPLVVVVAWAPLQSFTGYWMYKVSAPDAQSVGRRPMLAQQPRPRRTDDIISAAELAKSPARNVYDAIAQLRPQWLTGARLRSPTEQEQAGEEGVLKVYLGGAHYGSLESLRTFSTSGVAEIRFYNVRDATSRFGTGHPAGAVDVTIGTPK